MNALFLWLCFRRIFIFTLPWNVPRIISYNTVEKKEKKKKKEEEEKCFDFFLPKIKF